MKKNYLFTPGPTMVPPEVSLAEAQPMIHHRTPQFSQIFYEMSENLKYLFQTKTGDVFTLMSSGTGAMEACVANVLSKGDKALVVIRKNLVNAGQSYVSVLVLKPSPSMLRMARR